MTRTDKAKENKPAKQPTERRAAPKPHEGGNVFEREGVRTPWNDARTLEVAPGQPTRCPNCGTWGSILRKSEVTADGRLLLRSCKRCRCAYRVVETRRRPVPPLSDRRLG